MLQFRTNTKQVFSLYCIKLEKVRRLRVLRKSVCTLNLLLFVVAYYYPTMQNIKKEKLK